MVLAKALNMFEEHEKLNKEITCATTVGQTCYDMHEQQYIIIQRLCTVGNHEQMSAPISPYTADVRLYLGTEKTVILCNYSVVKDMVDGHKIHY